MSEPTPGPAERRRRRAALAEQLLDRHTPGAATPVSLDWAALDCAPVWFAWPEAALAALQCRVGALLGASEVRLWIDSARVGAARAVLGQPFLKALLALPAAAVIPAGLSARPPIARADEVAPRLRADGAGVLLAALPQGPLRAAAEAAWSLAAPSAMATALAEMLIGRALALAPLDPDDPALPAPAAPVRPRDPVLEMVP